MYMKRPCRMLKEENMLFRVVSEMRGEKPTEAIAQRYTWQYTSQYFVGAYYTRQGKEERYHLLSTVGQEALLFPSTRPHLKSQQLAEDESSTHCIEHALRFWILKEPLMA